MAVTRLRVALIEAKCPQYVIATAAGLYPSHLSDYANGKRPIPPKHLSRLAEVLKCSPEDLTGFEEDWVNLGKKSYRRCG